MKPEETETKRRQGQRGPDKGGPRTESVRRIISLARQGWKPARIAHAVCCSRQNVEKNLNRHLPGWWRLVYPERFPDLREALETKAT